jgi:hypothetical protein
MAHLALCGLLKHKMTVTTMSSQDQAPCALLGTPVKGLWWSCRLEKQAYGHFCHQEDGILYG